MYIFYQNLYVKNKIEKFSNSSDLIEEVKIIYQQDIGIMQDLTLFSEQMMNGLKIDSINANNIEVKKSVNILPKGIIMAFNGTTPPEGWYLCDGSKGTPDLRGRFILASGDFGSEDTNLTNRTFREEGGEENVTLKLDNLPTHEHIISESGEHPHEDTLRHLCYWKDNKHFQTAMDEGASGDHKISNSGNHNHTINETGGNQPHDNMPPYYVLAWIMKIN